MKTINQSYTPAQRKQIARDLRSVATPDYWNSTLPRQSYDYVEKVLLQYEQEFFSSFLIARGLNYDNYPGGHDGYIREALNRLADELEACK